MKPHFLIPFLLLFPHKGAAEPSAENKKTDLFPKNAQKDNTPMAFFPPTMNHEILEELGVGIDRKLTCAVLLAPTFVYNNAQAYGICYDAQNSCINQRGA